MQTIALKRNQAPCVIWAVLISLVMSMRGWADEPQPVELDVIRNATQYLRAHPEGTVTGSIPLDALSRTEANLPIGVFDSGIGGLTVLEAILQLDAYHNSTLAPGPDGRPDFEHERFIYLGDQANMPYGNYASAGKTDFLRELILRDATFLLGRHYWAADDAPQASLDKLPVKAIVIACNTATAYGLDDIRKTVDSLGIPVIVVGVVEAGARGVLEELPKSNDTPTIAVLATTGTCSSGAYPRAIGSALGLAGRRNPVVIQQGSVGLAGAIEGDPAYVSHSKETRTSDYQGPSLKHPTATLDPTLMEVYQFEATGLLGSTEEPDSLQLNSALNYIRYDVTTLLETHRKSGHTSPIRAVVLGCTHFPLLDDEFLAEFERLRNYEVDGEYPYRHLIAEDVQLINPAELTARELFRKLASARLFAAHTAVGVNSKKSADRCRLFLSVPSRTHVAADALTSTGAFTSEYKYGRQPGNFGREDTRVVPMTAIGIPDSGRQLIRNRLPAVSQFLPER